MARSSKASEELIQRRAKQLTQISEAISSLESCQSSNLTDWEKFDALDSVLEGMYEEIDKLTKKKPIEVATELMVEQVNDIIKETQKLITDDAYIEKLQIFVAAGDLPEFRDVLFVLRQLRQGMERFGKKLEQEKQQVDKLLHEAQVAKIALELFQRDYRPVDGLHFVVAEKEIKKSSRLIVPNDWATGSYGNERFDFDRLDYIEIEDYFKLS